MSRVRDLAKIAFLSAVLHGPLLAQAAKPPDAITQTKTFLWQEAPAGCCQQQNWIAPNGIATDSKTVSIQDVGFRVSAHVRQNAVWLGLAVNARMQMRVYALSKATLEVQGKTLKPVDADKRIRSIERSAAVRGVFTAVHGAKSSSDVEIQDQQGRPIGTATVTTRDEAATQRQLDQINQGAASKVAAYQGLLRDYDALPGQSPQGTIDFEVRIKKPTTATLRIQIGDTMYVLPFDLAPAR